MTDAILTSEKPLSMAELNEEVQKVKKRDKESGFRVTKMEEYLGQFLKLKNDEQQKLMNKLLGLNIPRIKEHHLIKIVDMMPITVDDIKMLMQGSPITISNDNIAKILTVVKDFNPKKDSGKD